MRLIVFCTLLLAACSTPVPDVREGLAARAYNDGLVHLHQRLLPVRANWAAALNTSEASAINRSSRAFTEELNHLSDSLRGHPDFEGDSSLRVALIQLLAAYRNSVARSAAVLPVLLTQDALPENAADSMSATDSLPPGDSFPDPHAALIPRYEGTARRTETAETAAWLHFLQVQQTFAQQHGFALARRRDSVWMQD